MSFAATQTPAHARVDVRQIPGPQRHPLIFATFHSLAPGEWMELVNDHDPKPLQYQFQSKVPGAFEWQYLQAGPDVWRVRIAKTAAVHAHAEGSCCGGCGGA